MNMRSRGMSLVLVIALLVPTLSIGIQNITDRSYIWIVYTESPDESMTLAAQTFKSEMMLAGCIIRETTLGQVERIPMHSDAIALVGHGNEVGIVVSEGIMSWNSLYDTIQARNPLYIISLACYSPTIPESGIFGFMGEIDAEAGAIIGTWYLSRVLGLKEIDSSLFTRAIEAQTSLNHPLSRVVYFVHGYFGEIDNFYDMRDYLEGNDLFGENNPYDSYEYFSYFDAFSASNILEKDLLHWVTTISDYAINFANEIIQNCDPGTQVSIVAHSLGGIITRQMLMLNRTNLEAAGIDFGSVITLGTPHKGTFLANQANWFSMAATLLPLIPNFQYWPSPILYSLYPGSPFLTILNYDPESYSEGIRWYTVAGYDSVRSLVLLPVHYESSDPLVGVSRAKLSFAQESPTYQDEHSYLLHDLNLSIPSVETWLRFDVDSDNDGLSDDMETYRYGTDKDDWDSDNDGIRDGDEVLIYSTDPLNPDSDFDNLSDFNEIAYGTDPLDEDSDSDGLLDGDEVNIYGSNPLSADSDSDTLSDWDEVHTHYSDPMDSDSDNDGLLDQDELNIHGTNLIAWSTDGDILSDGQEITWGYNATKTDDPIDAQYLTYSTWQVSGITGRVRANHYEAMDYVKVYVKYKNSLGYWTGDMHVGTEYDHDYYDDYFVEWSLLSGYVQMLVTVKAYDSANHYLGCDQQYVTLPDDGGGGRPGGDPLPE